VTFQSLLRCLPILLAFTLCLPCPALSTDSKAHTQYLLGAKLYEQEKHDEAIAALIGPWVEGPVRVRIGAPAPAADAPPRAARLTPRAADAERLKVLREKDPTLSDAVDALDLELME